MMKLNIYEVVIWIAWWMAIGLCFVSIIIIFVNFIKGWKK